MSDYHLLEKEKYKMAVKKTVLKTDFYLCPTFFPCRPIYVLHLSFIHTFLIKIREILLIHKCRIGSNEDYGHYLNLKKNAPKLRTAYYVEDWCIFEHY